MRIGILGGSGFIGRAVAHELTEKGDDVVIFTRKSSLPSLPGKIVRWNPYDIHHSVQDELLSCDAIVNLAGASIVGKRWTKKYKHILYDSRVRLTRNVVQIFIENKQYPAVWVQASAIGYYGDGGDEKIFVEADPPGHDFLAQLCVNWEKQVEPLTEHTRVCVTRFGIVLDRGSLMLTFMEPAFKLFVGGPPGSGRQWVSWIHRKDVVHIIDRMIRDGKLEGVYNVVAPNPVKMIELCKVFAQILHRPCLFRVPEYILKLIFGEGSQVLLVSQRVFPSRLVDLPYEFAYDDIRKALEALYTK